MLQPTIIFAPCHRYACSLPQRELNQNKRKEEEEEEEEEEAEFKEHMSLKNIIIQHNN